MRTLSTPLRLVSLILFGLAACGEDGTSPPELGSIAGTVRVEGAALEGVTVELGGAATGSATTDASGAFSFPDLDPGTYQVTISGWPDGVSFQDPDESVEVTGGSQATVEFAGTYIRTASLDGTVEVDGQGVADATVTLSGAESRETTTDASGGFRFAELRAGSYTVRVSGLGSNVVLDEEEKTVSVDVGGQASVAFTGERQDPAQVSVPYIERPGSELRINLEEVEGEVDVVAQVDPGTETVTRVRLFLGGRLVATREYPGGLTSAEKVELRVNTGAFDPDTGEPVFENGQTFVEAHVDTEAGSSVATDRLDITLANRARIAGVSPGDNGDGVVSQGRRWFGNRDLHFEVVPVLYDQSRTIGAISLQASGDPSANGGPSLDLGSGPGQPHKVEGPPFVFTARLADNVGLAEDDPSGSGHSLRVVGVFDGDGVEVTSDFVPGRTTPLQGYYVDFVPPQVPGGAAISVGGSVVAGGEWFSSGAFGVTSMTETGSGQATVSYEVDDADQTDPITGASSVADLQEKQNTKYELRVVQVRDAVGNTTPASAFPPASPAFGVDRTAVEVTNLIPSAFLILNPDDAAGDGIADNELSFSATDPKLPSGASASGYATSTAQAVSVNGASADITPSIAPNLTGTNRISMSALGETRWTITVTTKDGAKPANVSTFTYDVTLDKTAPAISITNPPPSSVNTSSGSVSFSIGGQVTDAHGLGQVQIVVRDADDNTPDTCEAIDAPISVGTGPGQLDANPIDVTDTADDFTAQVTVHSQGSGQQELCFYVEAEDAAEDRAGKPEPNTNKQFVRTLINWN